MSDDFGEETEALLAEFRRLAHNVAERMRSAANDIERHAATVHRDLHDLHLDVLGSADEIVRDVTSMMGNLDLHRLVRAATAADRQVRQQALAGASEEGDRG